MKWIISALALILSGAFVTELPKEAPQDSRVMVDALGTVRATRDNPRGGAFFGAPGNAGFVLHIRNWDGTQPMRSITGLVGFSPNSPTRVVGVKVHTVAADGREDPRLPIGEASVDARGLIQVENLSLQPAEGVALYVTLSSVPKDPYGFSFEAKY